MSLALGLVGCTKDTAPGTKEVNSGESPDDDFSEDESPAADQPAAPGASKDAGRSPSKDAGGGAAVDASKASSDDSATDADAGGSVDPDPGGDAGSFDAADSSTATPDAGALVPVPNTTKCQPTSAEPCGVFVTSSGKEIQLGKYGAVVERNVGTGFENTVNRLDTARSCAAFAASFGQDQEATDALLDLKGLDLALYTVYRPGTWVEGETYPIVSWGNGTCAQPEGYGALLRFVASQGFFVVAPNSRYVGSGNEQKRAIDFALKANADPTSPYFGKLDTAKVAAMGHSQGSQGTIAAASDVRIKTVILFNGGTSASKPFLGFSGDRDLGSPTAQTYETAVNRASKAAYIFFHNVPGTGNGDGHLTLMTQPERVNEPTVAWLKLLLHDDVESRDWFVGDSCKLCGHDADYEYGQKGL